LCINWSINKQGMIGGMYTPLAVVSRTRKVYAFNRWSKWRQIDASWKEGAVISPETSTRTFHRDHHQQQIQE
jgi:hypothetical protein